MNIDAKQQTHCAVLSKLEKKVDFDGQRRLLRSNRAPSMLSRAVSRVATQLCARPSFAVRTPVLAAARRCMSQQAAADSHKYDADDGLRRKLIYRSKQRFVTLMNPIPLRMSQHGACDRHGHWMLLTLIDSSQPADHISPSSLVPH